MNVALLRIDKFGDLVRVSEEANDKGGVSALQD